MYHVCPCCDVPWVHEPISMITVVVTGIVVSQGSHVLSCAARFFTAYSGLLLATVHCLTQCNSYMTHDLDMLESPESTGLPGAPLLQAVLSSMPIITSFICSSFLQVLRLPLRPSVLWTAGASPRQACMPPRPWWATLWRGSTRLDPLPGGRRMPQSSSLGLPFRSRLQRRCPR